MKLINAMAALDKFESLGKHIFSKGDLGVLFDERGETLSTTVKRLTKAKVLTKVVNAIYAGRNARQDEHLLPRIAAYLRSGEINYLSNESVLSQESVISQQMFDRITVMTTGRSGEFKTPFGVVEFTHTKRDPSKILEETTKPANYPLRLAGKLIAVRDLKRIGRNLDMINIDMLDAV